MSDVRGVLICANPFSGAGPNRRYVEGLVGALKAGGLEPRLVWDIQERKDLLADPGLAGWCRCVVVAGGDGSIGAVVNEIGAAGALSGGGASQDRGSNDSADPSGVKSGGGDRVVALATLPMGNENLFAKHFGFTRDVEALAKAIGLGQTRRVDLGRVGSCESGAIPGTIPGQGGQLFTLMAGVGFDADVVHRMDRWRSTPAQGVATRITPGSTRRSGLRRVRRASYLPRIVSSLWGYGYPSLTVEVDGQELTGSQLFVFNLPEYGGGLSLAPPGCRGDDGLLDWVLFERPGSVALLGYAWSVWRGRHLARGDVKHGRAARLAISAQAQAPIQVDGDPAGTAPVVLQVDGQAHLELLIT